MCSSGVCALAPLWPDVLDHKHVHTFDSVVESQLCSSTVPMKRKAAANPSDRKVATDAKTSNKSPKSSSHPPKLKGSKADSKVDCKVDSKALSERRLKQYSVAQKGKFPLTVGITGARCGDLLRGVEEASNGDVANVVLRLVAGQVAAPLIIRRSVEAELGREVLLAAVARHFGISRAAAELRPAGEVVDFLDVGTAGL